MKKVEPIRDKEKLLDVMDYLKERSFRDYILFLCGIYLARRVSDLLPMRVRDIKNKDYIYLLEKKTKKKIQIPVNRELQKEIRKYTEKMHQNDYLFPSQKGEHIKRGRAYEILKEAGEAVGLSNIGTHSMRKTFGFWFIQNGGNIETLAEIYGHSDPSITRRYIGITSKMANDAMSKFSFHF